MKGVESIIAIILILMIVIALAALAYTWFTGVFSSLTSTAGTAVTQTTGSMATQFSLETAQGSNGVATISTAIRNTGTSPIDPTYIEAYINDAHVTDNAAGVDITTGQAYSFTVTAGGNCACGTNRRCYTGTNMWVLTITIESGLQQKIEVTC